MVNNYCAKCIYERRCDSKGRLHMEQDMTDSRLRDYPMFFAVIGCRDRIEIGEGALNDVGEKKDSGDRGIAEATKPDGAHSSGDKDAGGNPDVDVPDEM